MTEQQATLTPCSITSDNTVYVSFNGDTINHIDVAGGLCCCTSARDGTIIEVNCTDGHHIKVAFCNECHLQVIPRDYNSKN